MARGFCLFNNVAIVAQHLISRHGLQRVAIVDFDVHHGNGTEKVFYSDHRVLFVSIHQDSLYPLETGQASCVGSGPGEGLNLNIPVPPGSGIGCYANITARVLLPALQRYDPEIVLLSAGYDACAFDPLSHTMLSSRCYYDMVHAICGVASSGSAQGRVLVLHEGGYSDVYAPYCMLRTVEALVNISPEESAVADPYEDEIRQYAYQALQPAQEEVISRAEEHVKKWIHQR
jgi:acetoin utilization deacetylase AcuC-like enzyme